MAPADNVGTVIWLVALVVVIAVLTAYASFTARRLDRLHVRVDLAGLALDEQLGRRAAAAGRLATIAELHGLPAAGKLTAASAAARAAANDGVLSHDREVVENALGAAIHGVLASPLALAKTLATADLVDQATRSAFARRFYNDAVRDALILRESRVVRWLHLAGTAPLPSYLELDDAVLPTVPPPRAGELAQTSYRAEPPAP